MTIYLDYNATSPLRPEARAVMLEAYDLGGNASSIHAYGRKARMLVENARMVLAQTFLCEPEELIFTSGGTEGNTSIWHTMPHGYSPFCSATAHDSTRRSAPSSVVFLPVLANGLLDCEAMVSLFESHKSPPFVSIEWVNSETGIIQPVAEIQKIVHAHKGLLHIDGVQALGKIKIERWGDYLTFSGHKIGGPQGVGALVVRDGRPFTPLFKGGGQEKGRRSGTENVAGIAGFAASATAITLPTPAWRDDFEKILQQLTGLKIIGHDVPRVPQTSCFVRAGFQANTLLIKLDLAGFAVSSGSACSSGKVGVSPVLTAMRLSQEEKQSALRVSYGWNSQQSDLKFLGLALTNGQIYGTN